MTNINDEMFNAFLMWATNSSSWQDEYGHVWGRTGEQGSEWDIQVLPTKDPYELLPFCVSATPPSTNNEMMLVMYGWATPIDDNMESTDGDRKRVRVLVHFRDGKERIALQFKGETLEEVPNGEGMFGDTIRQLRAVQSASN